MNESPERALERWLREGPEAGPAAPLQRALAATRSIGQRPGWATGEWWLGSPKPALRSLPRLAAVYLLAVLVLLAVVAAMVIGGQRKLPSPDGPAGNGVIALVKDGRLQLTDPDGSGPRLVDGGLGMEYASAFSPDGTRLAFWTRQRPGESLRLLVLDLESGRTVDVTGGATLFGAELWPPAWSPDGRRVAFAARVEGTLRPFVAEASGSGSSVIAADVVGATAPAWSPDGRWIAFRSVQDGMAEHPNGPRQQVSTGLYAIDPDERTVLELARPEPEIDTAIEPPQWLADGSAVVTGFGANGEGSVAVVDLNGEIRTLSAPAERARAGTRSPDGARIAYLSDRRLRIVNIDGTGARDLGNARQYCDLWQWSPDGAEILAASSDCRDTISISVATGEVRLIQTGVGPYKPDWQRVAP